MKNRLLDVVIPMLPKNEMSHFIGRLVHQRLPLPVSRMSVSAFAKYYNINMQEAEHPISHYKSIGELFTRRLKSGVRPIASDAVVHPADAQITEAGVIDQMTLVQAKGKTYTVPELLKSTHHAADFEGGSFFTYYLCPTDYHRVHSPVDGEILWSCHVPGQLWPVNAWSVNKIENLFAVNERIAVIIQTPKGKAALVMVAATNVGNMSMSFDDSLSTRLRHAERQVRERTYSPQIPIKRGEEIGIFHMGSTVVMLYEKGMIEADPETYRHRHIKMGQGLVPGS
jgi:phosphatidylserine decarboxylase